MSNPDDIAARLCGIASGIIGTTLSPEDDFYDAGGTYLFAVKLVGEARKANLTGVTVELVQKHRTLAAVARHLAQPAEAGAGARPQTMQELWEGAGSTWQEPLAETVVPLIEGEGTPFFCAHWGTGNIEFLSRFAAAASFDRPLYGIRSGPIARRERPLLSVRERAARHLAEIRRIQPHGPYLLGGLCSGGLLALELADLLVADGERVAEVALINSVPATAPHSFDPGWGLDDLYRFRMAWMRRNFKITNPAQAAEIIMPQIREADWCDRSTPDTDWGWLQLAWAALALSQVHHQMRRYDGHAAVFQQPDPADDPRNSWAPWLGEYDEYHYATGDTYEVVQQESFWPDLRKALDAAMARESA
ncbi:thioesterase domain-containing protein [Krasilnikovia cinnamomea]|uniref:Thioesterase domain-containing protein n=1 Tax=Krasilnikovia cinnamomea TaxID=349313 RepID=A0A4Q7ZKA0_9ACTN|nr:thioesterase domain-containing protein [Krasilnikovia cinnamomea]RZU50941.1 thioesterase domain-containing protein [Krasilnikovia cinnamomea]